MDLAPIREFLVVYGICVARITAACSIAPFMSSRIVPAQLRNSIVFSWGLVVYPIVAPTVDVVEFSLLDMVAILLKEVFLGLLMGFMAAKAFWIATSVGFFIDNQRGASMASVFDPAMGEQTSPLGEFLQHSVMAIFYVGGGFLLFLGGLFESFAVWPVASYFPNFSSELPLYFLSILDDLVRTVVVLAAPIVITVFLSEFGLGLMNRFAPQLNVFFLAMPVKSLVAILVLILYVPTLMVLFNEEHVAPQSLFEAFGRILQ